VTNVSDELEEEEEGEEDKEEGVKCEVAWSRHFGRGNVTPTVTVRNCTVTSPESGNINLEGLGTV